MLKVTLMKAAAKVVMIIVTLTIWMGKRVIVSVVVRVLMFVMAVVREEVTVLDTEIMHDGENDGKKFGKVLKQ